MIGTVAAVSRRRAMVAVLTDEGDYSLMEMIFDDPPDLGDRVEWHADTPLGRADVVNLSSPLRRTLHVFFQNHHSSARAVRTNSLMR